MVNVKGFGEKQTARQMGRWTDGQMDGPKTICPRSIDAGPEKKVSI